MHGWLFVMHEFIPKKIHQTHTGSWSLVKLKSTVSKTGYYIRASCILMRWPDGSTLGMALVALAQVQRATVDLFLITSRHAWLKILTQPRQLSFF